MGDHRLRRLLQNPIHGGEELLARDSGAVRKFPDEVMDKIDCPILARPDDRVDFCKFVLIENRTNPSILFRILNGGAVAGGKQELQQGCSAVQQQVFLRRNCAIIEKVAEIPDLVLVFVVLVPLGEEKSRHVKWFGGAGQNIRQGALHRAVPAQIHHRKLLIYVLLPEIGFQQNQFPLRLLLHFLEHAADDRLFFRILQFAECLLQGFLPAPGAFRKISSFQSQFLNLIADLYPIPNRTVFQKRRHVMNGCDCRHGQTSAGNIQVMPLECLICDTVKGTLDKLPFPCKEEHLLNVVLLQEVLDPGNIPVDRRPQNRIAKCMVKVRILLRRFSCKKRIQYRHAKRIRLLFRGHIPECPDRL